MDLNWYKTLAKPQFTPPSEVFTPAWTVLYVLIFTSVLVYINTDTNRSKARGCVFFILQLALNLCWSPVFFMLHRIKLAFLVVCLMFVFTFLTIVEFFKISKIAALLLVPYLLWIGFAVYLNYGFMVLN